MTQEEIFAKVKHHADRLHYLFADPQSGLLTWNEFVRDHWKALADLWGGAK